MDQEPTTPPPAPEPVDVIQAAWERLLLREIQAEQEEERRKSA